MWILFFSNVFWKIWVHWWHWLSLAVSPGSEDWHVLLAITSSCRCNPVHCGLKQDEGNCVHPHKLKITCVVSLGDTGEGNIPIVTPCYSGIYHVQISFNWWALDCFQIIFLNSTVLFCRRNQLQQRQLMKRSKWHRWFVPLTTRKSVYHVVVRKRKTYLLQWVAVRCLVLW